MLSERLKRQVDRLLDDAEAAVHSGDWASVAEKARATLAIDPGNEDAPALIRAAQANLGSAPSETPALAPEPSRSDQPSSFAGGRYEVRRFLGEGGKKRVFLAHDIRLDRDVAFALIKTEGLDAIGRERIEREAQAMGRLGAHPHIVTIFEIGEEGGAPFVVTELMGGGDVEGLIEKAEGPLELRRALEIAKGVCRGLQFAHTQGIVHRDLKPGNVWLTADGVAKIGDFGLAVALDRSRLTSHGLMVGTVAYMPPEQALGGEVTPQADLYSLGAMLYELVTGRPPFQADDPTAVISQHINTPPVAPSWHTAHCPPDLEALILRLLEKAPADRTKDASEVLVALETVDPDARSVSHSGASANPLDRLARGVFVGRERELTRLRAAFDDAFAGQGGVVVLVGEPGIGKTRTVQELSTYARTRGGRVIWGQSHEAAGAPPYRPWVQAGDHYAQQFGLQGIADRLQVHDASELSRIFPGLHTQPNYVPPQEASDPDVAQFRLFEAYAHLLGAYSTETPLLVVLDDLHWADKPTLLLLRHVARELGRMRLLLVGTYRDTELARTHPLSETLAELNRGDGFTRINLSGLTRDEVADYIRNAAHIEPPREHVDRLFEETEGNPFFLTEVVNLLTQEGTLTATSLSGVAIPEGVREALGRRLDRLSEDANVLFQYAAVAGRQFAYDTLHLVTDHDDDTLLRLIEEGLAARVIEEAEQPGRYRFTHALMQETLLAELSTTRRVRMHGQVGEAIEARLGDRAAEQAPRLARHFAESATLNESHAAKAVRYSRLAGDEAVSKAAWAEAARHYENAVSLLEQFPELQVDDRAALLHGLGKALAIAGAWRDGWRRMMQAADLYRSTGDANGLARLALDALMAQPGYSRREPLLAEALEMDARLDPGLEVRVRAERAWGLVQLGREDETRAEVNLIEVANPSARTAEVDGYLALIRGTFAVAGGDLDQGEQLFNEAYATFESIGSTGVSAVGTELGRIYTRRGDLDALYEGTLRGLANARAMGRVFDEQNAMGTVAAIDALRGDFEKALASIADVAKPATNPLSLLGAAAVAEATGQPDLTSFVPPIEAAGRNPGFVPPVRGMRARMFDLVGNAASAGQEAEAVVDVVRARSSRLIPVVDRLLWAGMALLHGSDSALEFTAECLAEDPWRATFIGSVDLIRGHLALRLDRPLTEAEEHFQAGLEWSESNKYLVEAGRCLQGLAEVGERRGDLAAARAHLDAAGERFAAWGAKRYLDQVLAKKDFLKA